MADNEDLELLPENNDTERGQPSQNQTRVSPLVEKLEKRIKKIEIFLQDFGFE